MKTKFLFITLIAFALFSCNEPKSKSIANKKQDSIKIIRNRKIKDSLEVIELKRKEARIEKSKIAFGGAKFGMSVNQVMKTDIFKGGYSSAYGNSAYARPSYKNSKIGEYEYDIEAIFNQDSLYSITIQSPFETANYIDTKVIDCANNMREVIQLKYGYADNTYGTPEFYNYKPGYIQWMYKWEIEDKVILIGLMEKSSGSEYNSYTMIYNKKMKDRVNKNENIKEDDNKKSDSNKF